MNIFRSFLEEEYAADPSGSARFLSDSCVLVRIRRRYWKGLKKMAKAEVTADGTVVDENVTTRPSWKLCPAVMKAEFESLGSEVEALVDKYALNRGSGKTFDDEDEAGPALVGNGTYAIDAGAWPGLYDKLRVAQEVTSTAADRWCSEDGYQRIHDELKEQIGETAYALVKDLIPKQDVLRRKFGLDVRRAPVRFVEDTKDDGELETSRRRELVDLFELAVRTPRIAAAEAWEGLAQQLIDSLGCPITPPVLVDKKTGESKPGTRKLSGKSIIVAGREASNLALKAWKWVEDPFRGMIQAIVNELPEAKAEASVVAKNLNGGDDEAVRIGKMLVAAAAQARSESGMCEGFAAAKTR